MDKKLIPAVNAFHTFVEALRELNGEIEVVCAIVKQGCKGLTQSTLPPDLANEVYCFMADAPVAEVEEFGGETMQ